MKKILGLDLGTNSIGWALVSEGEDISERSSIIKLGVRVNPLTVDEQQNFEKGKSITTNADRTLKRSMRRNLQRYKLRREQLIAVLKENNFINDETILSENGNKSTFETYKLRAKAASDEITLSEFARVLLMINKKRGYKSSRKAKSQDEGQLIDGMEIAKKLYDEDITPGQLVLQILKSGNRYLPEFYRSDLQSEFDRIWEYQSQYHPDILVEDFKTQIAGRGKQNTSKIFLGRFGIYTADNKGTDKRLQAYQWRVDALKNALSKEILAFVISDLNGSISNSSGYLGSISDRSKELYFKNQTVGQFLMLQLEKNPHTRLKNQVFYRQDYLDEFNIIWERQAQFHNELNPELKKDIRDIIIFYQRRLKSQKGLINYCEFESRKIQVEIEGKQKIKFTGSKVCPKSSPLFQEFKIWQILNNLKVIDKLSKISRNLEQDEKEILFSELTYKPKLTKTEVLKLLFKNHRDLDLNFKDVEGNRTQATLVDAYLRIIELSGHDKSDLSKMSANEIKQYVSLIFKGLGYNTEILDFNSDLDSKTFEKQPMFQLWHLLYSFEGDDSKTGNEKLINKLKDLFGFEKEHATILANLSFQPDYGSLSTKAIRKIMPYLKSGNEYSLACEYAGYRHSKSSLTKDELDNKVLKDKLEILSKNTLRNPVVEKILNQMINMVNTVTDIYGKPDEIRIELARELKKSAKEREELTAFIGQSTIEHEKYRAILQKEFGISQVTRNDIIRYKLYLELEPRGFQTLYSSTYIPPYKLFSKEFDIEHIIPQARLFDDSFSNKTLEARGINIEKANDTAVDYVTNKYGAAGLAEYLNRIEDLYNEGKISKSKYNKLKMKGDEIPSDFIARDLRDTQYIAKKAKTILEELVRDVVSTSGSITDRLREDWQLIDVMQELNWNKYEQIGLTEIIENRDGQRLRRIKDWTKRNDHRHHAMDALTIAFTKRSFIQYLNNLNARSDKSGSIYAIEQKELYRDDKGKLRFKPPMPLNDFRTEAKRQLENVLVSIKAKNKVATSNINTTGKIGGTNKKIQLTPRGQLHKESVYGSIQQYICKEERVGASFTEQKIAEVAKSSYRIALLKRLKAFDDNPKKAFTGANSLAKNPVFIDEMQTSCVPERVKTVAKEIIFTIRKDVSPDMRLEKIVDVGVRKILQGRLDEFGGDSKKAFSNLDENPIWLNKEAGIAIKCVTISDINNAVALHDKKDKEGNLILNSEGRKQAVDFVQTSNNHHVAVYRDSDGNLQENVVSFFEATSRVTMGMPIIDKEFRRADGWEFLFSMKQNEYFVFPNEKTGFNPNDIDLMSPQNYNLISPNLYRVQKISSKNYVFNHHLETKAVDGELLKNKKVLLGITHHFIQTPSKLSKIVKVRVDHLGQIVEIGEY